MFRDPAVPHPAGTIDPARDVRTMEDEVILADLGVVERRLERLERDLKKGNNADLRKEQEILLRCRTALEEGRALRALDLASDDARRLRGFQFLSAKPLLIVLNLDEADLPQRRRRRAARRHRIVPRLAPPPARCRSARRSSSRSRSSNPPTRPRSWRIWVCASPGSTV